MSIYATMANSVLQQLKRRYMEGYYCETRQEAADLACSLVPPGASVSWGGSATLGQLGILDRLQASGCKMIDYPAKEKEQIGSPIFQEVAGADVFLMGANALTLQGELVNIDGVSNRLSSLLHGPKQVIVLVGINKLVKTVEDGIHRIQTSVAPVLAERTGRKTPCALTGICRQCNSPQCMCCNLVITRHSRYPGRIRVILIGEALGV